MSEQPIVIPWDGGEVEIKATFGAALKLESPFGISFAQIAEKLESNGFMFNDWLIFLKAALETTDVKSTQQERRDLMADQWGTLALPLSAWFVRCIEPQLKKMAEAASIATAEDE